VVLYESTCVIFNTSLFVPSSSEEVYTGVLKFSFLQESEDPTAWAAKFPFCNEECEDPTAMLHHLRRRDGATGGAPSSPPPHTHTFSRCRRSPCCTPPPSAARAGCTPPQSVARAERRSIRRCVVLLLSSQCWNVSLGGGGHASAAAAAIPLVRLRDAATACLHMDRTRAKSFCSK
jgi:hypothetical protein